MCRKAGQGTNSVIGFTKPVAFDIESLALSDLPISLRQQSIRGQVQ